MVSSNANDTEMRRKLFVSIEGAFVRCVVVAVIFVCLTEQKLEAAGQGDGWIRINLTTLVRQMLPFASKFILENGMDPLTIPDVGQSFRIAGPMLFLPAVQGEVTFSFSSGLLYYLSRLEGLKYVNVAYSGQTITVDASIAFDNIMVSYDYFVKLLFLRQEGKVIADATSISTNVRFIFNIFSCELALKEIEIIGIESIAITIQGNNLVEQLITPLSHLVTLLIKKALIEEIERRMPTLFRLYLDKTNLRLCPWDIMEIITTMLADADVSGWQDSR